VTDTRTEIASSPNSVPVPAAGHPEYEKRACLAN
jgi:hypothetical protein